MIIQGQIKGLKKGTLYLQKMKDTILVSVDSVQINGDGNFILSDEVESPEVYLYLLILLVFALAASYHVLTECLKDPDRSRYKIMLRCILIITNVVPPELPMQLSMAVNFSIIQLIQK